jgi:hypothetical protein
MFERTDRFRADFRRLSDAEKDAVLSKLADFNSACEQYAQDPTTRWPAALRIKDVEGAPGVMEVTFSFSGPDLRATFEWTHIDGELAVRWRRIGRHAVFGKP